MKINPLAASAAVAIALSFGMATAVSAQDADPAPVEMGSAVSEEKLQVFAVAYLEVNQIVQLYEPQVQAATDDNARMALQQQAQAEMSLVVDNLEGLSIDEYNQIYDMAQADPAVAQQIQGHLDALTQQ